jgi:predicted transcriptional regulator
MSTGRRVRAINMTIPLDLLRALDDLAKAEGRTRSGVVCEAVRRYLAKRTAAKKRGSRLLSRLAAGAVAGPGLKSADIDRVLYGKRRAQWRR